MRSSRWTNFLAGVRAEFPLLVGVFPFGLIYGALAMGAGLSPVVGQAMSSVVFAGSSQFIATQLLKDNWPALVVVATIAVVNLRHLLYSASIAPYLSNLSGRWKILLAYLLTDEAYAPAIVRFEQLGVTPNGHWFLFGAGLALWTIWQVSTALGIFLGASLPGNNLLDFALPLTFIAMVVPILRNRAMVAAALVAAVIAVLAAALPYKLGLIIAGLVGIAVGTLLERKS